MAAATVSPAPANTGSTSTSTSTADSLVRPAFASREPSQASTASDDTFHIPVSNSASSLGLDSTIHPDPLTHASYPDNLPMTAADLDDPSTTTTATNQLGFHASPRSPISPGSDGTSYPTRSMPLRSSSSSSSGGGLASPTDTVTAQPRFDERSDMGETDDARTPTKSQFLTTSSSSPNSQRSDLGTGPGQVARGGKLGSSYPPISEDDDEAREVEKNLERWAAEERQRRKALRQSRTGSLLAPPAASALARRLSSLRRNPSSAGNGPTLARPPNADGSPTEQVPLEELLEEEGGSSSTHSGSFGRKTGTAYGSRSSSGAFGPSGLRESVSSLDSYTSADALTRSASHTNVRGAVTQKDASVISPVNKGFFEIDEASANGLALAAGANEDDFVEHRAGGDPASNGTPQAASRRRDSAMSAKLKGKGKALSYEAGSSAAHSDGGGANGSATSPNLRNPFDDSAEDQLNGEEGDVSNFAMSHDHDSLQFSPSSSTTAGNSRRRSSNPPQVRILHDSSLPSNTDSQHMHGLSRSSSSYASSSSPAYAKPNPSPLRPIVTVGREAPATLERQRREAREHQERQRMTRRSRSGSSGGAGGAESYLVGSRNGSADGFPSIVATDADAEMEAARAARARGGDGGGGAGSESEEDDLGDRYAGGSGGYHMQGGRNLYGRDTGGGLGRPRSHRTIAEGDEGIRSDEDDEEQHRASKQRDARFNDVGLDDAVAAEQRQQKLQRRRRAAAAARAAAEEEAMRAERKMWWTEWLCGCGRHAMDEDEQQYGKTNPMG
ncbi:hypothetical protein OC846_005248 [Tilletia horrida]|uniref:Uncharacterized protein n=1 Tax=Tilletia horrida TaxID=155126 RepID=A0AAN6GM75_9BASI|nr:hypothetical protein OC846_005248 [Tilletia horrida]KAK0562258.1 hypothetical protein OC861_005418 [Tilletia horrida]